jgi:hypothetical protein
VTGTLPSDGRVLVPELAMLSRALSLASCRNRGVRLKACVGRVL